MSGLQVQTLEPNEHRVTTATRHQRQRLMSPASHKPHLYNSPDTCQDSISSSVCNSSYAIDVSPIALSPARIRQRVASSPPSSRPLITPTPKTQDRCVCGEYFAQRSQQCTNCGADRSWIDSRRPACNMDHFSGNHVGSVTTTSLSVVRPAATSQASIKAARRMQGTTRVILNELEEMLMLEAGYLARVFHNWHCQTMIRRVGKCYEEEFAQHQKKWEAHLAEHQRSFDAEIQKASQQNIDQQMHVQAWRAFTLKKRNESDLAGLVHDCLQNWAFAASKAAQAKSFAFYCQGAVYRTSALSVQNGVYSTFMHWHHQVQRDLLSARYNAKLDDLAKLNRDACTQAEEALQAGLVSIQAHHKKSKRNLTTIITRWNLSDCNRLVSEVFEAWANMAHKARNLKMRSHSARRAIFRLQSEAQLVTLGCTMTAWHALTRKHNEMAVEQQKSEKRLENERSRLELQNQENQSRHNRAIGTVHKALQLAANKSELDAASFLFSQIFQSWYMLSVKRMAKSLLEQVAGMGLQRLSDHNAKGCMRSCLLHWAWCSSTSCLIRSQKVELASETALLQSILEDKCNQFQAERDAHKAEASQLYQANQLAITYMVQKWDAHTAGRTLSVSFREWRAAASASVRGLLHQHCRNNVFSRVSRSNDKAAIQLVFMCWRSTADGQGRKRAHEGQLLAQRGLWEASAAEVSRQHENLQAQMRKTTEARLLDAQTKFQLHVLVAANVLLRRWEESTGFVNSAVIFEFWKSSARTSKQLYSRAHACRKSVAKLLQFEIAGLLRVLFLNWTQVARLASHLMQLKTKDAELRNLSALQKIQVERGDHLMWQVLSKIGLHQQQALSTEILAHWCGFCQGERLKRDHHEESRRKMHRYSYLMASLLFKKLHCANISVCLAEWHRRSQFLKYERDHDKVQGTIMEAEGYIMQLEQRTATLEEQLCLVYKQVDHVTETLQKELRTKEELASELRCAYDKMRTSCLHHSTRAEIFDSSEQNRGTSIVSSLLSRSQSLGSLSASRAGRSSANSRVGCDKPSQRQRGVGVVPAEAGRTANKASCQHCKSCDDSQPRTAILRRLQEERMLKLEDV